MPKLYLLGGENVSCRSAKEINQAAFEDAPPQPSVLVFSWARPSFDSQYQKRKLFTDYMRMLGASEVIYAEYGETEEALKKRFDTADLVYLTGGQACVLLERAQKMELGILLKEFGGVVVGRSAGALALCGRCITTVREKKRVRLVEGLGLAPLTLKAHYISQNNAALERFSLGNTIFAVPKDAALIQDGNLLKAYGEVFLFKNGKRETFTEMQL